VISRFRFALVLAAWATLVAPLASQTPVDLTRERDEFAGWLRSSPISPFAALVRQAIGQGLTLGPADSDIPLTGVAQHRALQRHGLITLESSTGARVMPRGRPVRIGDYTLLVDGSADRAVLTVFGPQRARKAPEYFAYERALVYEGGLRPPDHAGQVRILTLEGTEVDATEAGTIDLPVGGTKARLLVRRIPVGAGEESDLEIFFRDDTNGQETYPAGRFVSLLPIGGGRYRLDFNRARNPFCAYNSAYPCPAPWKGNAIATPIRAGELYHGVGISAPAVEGAR
jgi:uncharacterized protein